MRATPFQTTLSDHESTAAGPSLPLVCWSEDHSSQCTALSHLCIFWTSQLYCARQQENRLMGAGERNSWKLNAMCPHEFLRALSSYCATNVWDSNINRSADVLSWVQTYQQGRASSPVSPVKNNTQWHLSTRAHSRSVTVAALVWIRGEPLSLEANVLMKDWLWTSAGFPWVCAMSVCVIKVEREAEGTHDVKRISMIT